MGWYKHDEDTWRLSESGPKGYGDVGEVYKVSSSNYVALSYSSGMRDEFEVLAKAKRFVEKYKHW